MAGFVAGLDRGQATLLPECLEDCLRRADALVRTRPERLVEFERGFGVGQRAGLNPEPSRDADITFGRSQPRVGRQRAAKPGEMKSIVAPCQRLRLEL